MHLILNKFSWDASLQKNISTQYLWQNSFSFLTYEPKATNDKTLSNVIHLVWKLQVIWKNSTSCKYTTNVCLLLIHLSFTALIKTVAGLPLIHVKSQFSVSESPVWMFSIIPFELAGTLFLAVIFYLLVCVPVTQCCFHFCNSAQWEESRSIALRKVTVVHVPVTNCIWKSVVILW